jgi:hypothetical protein
MPGQLPDRLAVFVFVAQRCVWTVGFVSYGVIFDDATVQTCIFDSDVGRDDDRERESGLRAPAAH